MASETKLSNEELDEACARDWKQIALFLADCQAATAEYQNSLSRTSRAEKERHANICKIAAQSLRAGMLVGAHRPQSRDEAHIIERCERAVRGGE